MRVTYGPTPRYQMSAVTSQSLQMPPHCVRVPRCQKAEVQYQSVSHKFRESASTRRTLADCRNQPIYIPYILAYKSQNLRQNLDLKVGGATYTRVIKWRIFPAAEIRSFRPVEPHDSVLLLCDVVPPICFPSFTVSLPQLTCRSIAYYWLTGWSQLRISGYATPPHSSPVCGKWPWRLSLTTTL